LRYGKFTNAIDQMNDKMRSYFSENKIKDTWNSLIYQYGEFNLIKESSLKKEGNMQIVDLLCNFVKGDLVVRVVLDTEKKVAGLWFLPPSPPPYEPPDYVNEKYFKEVEISFGKDPWKLPGTLTIPKAKGPFPATILVHGSGPHDRDETIGPNRPFRDIAWGLSSQGIVVLRYDKRTYVHGKRMQPSEITVEEEVIQDAIEALRFLNKRDEVKKGGVFLIGHSLGATLAPEIAFRYKDLAGIIMLAGIARPLEEVTYEQVTYISSLKPQLSQTEKEELNSLLTKLKSIQEGGFPENEMLLGMSGKYFYDLRKRNQIDFAKRLKVPIFILQGERDYQSTMVDFNLWQKAIGKNANVTMKSYPDLNHLFMTGEGKATPDEYLKSGHVEGKIIEDMINWINSRVGK
ncbi:MAG: alpha/beta fold hydrolase, partial [Fidelibacterota bacterium]